MSKLAKIGEKMPSLAGDLAQTVAWWMVCAVMVLPSGLLLLLGILPRWGWVAILVPNLTVAIYLTQPAYERIAAAFVKQREIGPNKGVLINILWLTLGLLLGATVLVVLATFFGYTEWGGT